MADIHLTVSEGERDLLVRMLSASVKKKRVEVHRTEFSRAFREELESEEQLMESLLERLDHARS